MYLDNSESGQATSATNTCEDRSEGKVKNESAHQAGGAKLSCWPYDSRKDDPVMPTDSRAQSVGNARGTQQCGRGRDALRKTPHNGDMMEVARLCLVRSVDCSTCWGTTQLSGVQWATSNCELGQSKSVQEHTV